MSDYIFFDKDIEACKSGAVYGNADIYELSLKDGTEAINIHKDDVIHLAKLFGLNVYESTSML